jgi:hypothetical protein
MKTPMQELINNLTEQLDKVVKEHSIEVGNDTYWRGVKIGLETAIKLSESMLDVEKDTFIGFGDNISYLNYGYVNDSNLVWNEMFNTNEK